MAKKNETPEVENTEVAETAEVEATEPAVKGRPSKLTDDQVIDIRTRYHTVKKEDLAKEYGISTAYLYKVATGMAAKGVDFALVPKPEKVEEPAAEPETDTDTASGSAPSAE